MVGFDPARIARFHSPVPRSTHPPSKAAEVASKADLAWQVSSMASKVGLAA